MPRFVGCLAYKGKENAKQQILNGALLDSALDELYLMVTSDLCRALTFTGVESDVPPNSNSSHQEDEDLEDNESNNTNPSNQFGLDHQNSTSSEVTQRKVYTCDYSSCGKSYHCLSELSRHQNVHTANKIYYCKWTNCNFISFYNESAIEHVGRIHLKRRTKGPEKESFRNDAKLYIGLNQESANVLHQGTASTDQFGSKRIKPSISFIKTVQPKATNPIKNVNNESNDHQLGGPSNQPSTKENALNLSELRKKWDFDVTSYETQNFDDDEDDENDV